MGWFGSSGGGNVVPNGYDATQIDNALYGNKVINGQLVPVLTTRQYHPSQAAAPYWYGNGSKPATLAGFSPMMGGSVAASGAYMGGSAPMSGGYDGNPWDVSSPVPWAIAFLIIGFIGLRHVHWRA